MLFTRRETRLKKIENCISHDKECLQPKVGIYKCIHQTLEHYNQARLPVFRSVFYYEYKKEMENDAQKERKIIRRVLGPRHGMKLRSNKEVYLK